MTAVEEGYAPSPTFTSKKIMALAKKTCTSYCRLHYAHDRCPASPTLRAKTFRRGTRINAWIEARSARNCMRIEVAAFHVNGVPCEVEGR
jgi:hypothetical protein